MSTEERDNHQRISALREKVRARWNQRTSFRCGACREPCMEWALYCPWCGFHPGAESPGVSVNPRREPGDAKDVQPKQKPSPTCRVCKEMIGSRHTDKKQCGTGFVGIGDC